MTREEWLALVEREEGMALVSELVEQVLSRTKDIIFEKQIAKKILPYAVSYAKESMLGLVKVRGGCAQCRVVALLTRHRVSLLTSTTAY